jgi:hypothetical protein
MDLVAADRLTHIVSADRRHHDIDLSPIKGVFEHGLDGAKVEEIQDSPVVRNDQDIDVAECVALIPCDGAEQRNVLHAASFEPAANALKNLECLNSIHRPNVACPRGNFT